MTLTHLILFNLYLAGWLGLYGLLFSRKTFFSLNRFILLVGVLMAAILPFCQFTWTGGSAVAAAAVTTPVVEKYGGLIFHSGTLSPQATFPYGRILVWIYWMGVTGMIFRLVLKLVRLNRLICHCSRKKYTDHVHVITSGPQEVYSFLYYLFAPAQLPQAMLIHELIHIRQKHSLDILLLETIKIFCWFNPAVYAYQGALRAVHEYMADAVTVQSANKSAYAHLLVNQAFHVSGIALTHSFFNRSQLQKRLIMLQKKTASKAGWQYLLIIPFVAILVLISSPSFALRGGLEHTLSWIKPPKTSIPPMNLVKTVPVDLQGQVTSQAGKPLSGVTVIKEGTVEGTITDADGRFTLKAIQPDGLLQFSMVGYTTVAAKIKTGMSSLTVVLYEEPHRIDRVVVVGYASGEAAGVPAKAEKKGPIFTFVEQMPAFPGGKEALMKYLAQQVRYPQAARKAHLEGTVTVSFVISQDGSISQVKTLSSPIGGGLEQEAERVVQSMPHWQPGRQNGHSVEVLNTLPIQFILK